MDDMKVCTKCGERKKATEFPRDKSRPDGRFPWCKACKRQADGDYYRRNSDRVRKRVSEHYRANRAKINRARRAQWQANREEMSRRRAEAYAADPDRYREHSRQDRRRRKEAIRKYKREWRKSNPDKVKAAHQRRRARKQKADGSFTGREWAALKKKYDYTCLRCGRREPDIRLVPDHVIPLSVGGSNNIENIQPLCFRCNDIKHVKTTDYRRDCRGEARR